ncbi:DUF885 domain-containing protein [Paremcibacter congregatus]|uniref:DUF885 domain-containing protein n=1 Tax=Paremcibacter congregatus TaxID=2043170 RepID=UPI003A8E55A2
MRKKLLLLASVVALSGAASLPSLAAEQVSVAASENSARLLRFLEDIYQTALQESPMLQSQQGLTPVQDGWDDLSSEAENRNLAALWQSLRTLHRNFDYATLDEAGQFNYRVLEEELKLRIERHGWRDNLYPLNQIVGHHVLIVGTLVNYHNISSRQDAEAYITRIKTVGQPINQLRAQITARQAKGIYLPKHLLPRLIGGSEQSISGYPFDPDSQMDNVVFSDFKRKVDLLDIAAADKDQLIKNAKVALLDKFGPAYRGLMATLNAQVPLAKEDYGVWNMPDGDRFYQFLIRQFTTTDMTPEEVHKLGLSEVARIHGEMRKIMHKVGFDGDLQAFFTFLKKDPRFYYENTDAGRQGYLQAARKTLADMTARMDEILPYRPKSNLVIKRFEEYREKSSPGAFYESGSADGSRPGNIYVNLYDMTNVSKVDMEALMFHEGIPGHHMQYSLINSRPEIPRMRTYEIWWSNTALTEGWALYAESYARELGFYQDPYSDFGRLAGELWRACRLVVDSGLHYKRWSRDKAVAYLNDNTSSPPEANYRAVDRYLAVPGQATAFKVGMNRIIEEREKARALLGDRFDIREFHYAVLKHGSISLKAMQASVAAWIKQKQP